MKKAYRKDVVIARLVFVVFCLVIVMLIVCAVMFARNHMQQKAAQETQVQETQTETQQEETQEPGTEYGQQEETQEPGIEDAQQEETLPTVVTTSDVNLRTEPNTSCDVITVISSGTQLELLGEEDGWAQVSYGGETGYVSMDYIEEVTDLE